MTRAVVEEPMLLLVRTLHGAGASTIGFFFLVFVMIATAQQDVVARMKAEGMTLGYSSALALENQVKAQRDDEIKQKNQEASVNAKLTDAQLALDEAQRDFETAWVELKATADRISRLGLCNLSPTEPDSANLRRAVASELQQCDSDPSTGASNVRIVQTAKGQATQFTPISQKYVAAYIRMSSLTQQLANTHAQLVADQTFTDDQQKAHRSFGDMNVLLKPWVLFGQNLIQFPPALLQILLTFVSGLFGALLVTLILIVYPRTRIAKASQAKPVTRTFLGGLIAVCVYIVLLSGIAVVGSGTSGSGAGSNYMAFCGIGILAGMFSDRVAGWLSERADQFFSAAAHPGGRNTAASTSPNTADAP
ncbi:hypothetical protein [Sphingomonas sp.]|uniref:hypothetical protein n=1 Tax=Sphingomonas sp. TaxID=28214 RepID=UPI00389CC716